MPRKRKIIAHRNLTIGIIVILFIGVVISVIYSGAFASMQTNTIKQTSSINNTYRIPNLNITDVISTTHDSKYVSTYVGRITLFFPEDPYADLFVLLSTYPLID